MATVEINDELDVEINDVHFSDSDYREVIQRAWDNLASYDQDIFMSNNNLKSTDEDPDLGAMIQDYKLLSINDQTTFRDQFDLIVATDYIAIGKDVLYAKMKNLIDRTEDLAKELKGVRDAIK